jgi:hypothetical protein
MKSCKELKQLHLHRPLLQEEFPSKEFQAGFAGPYAFLFSLSSTSSLLLRRSPSISSNPPLNEKDHASAEETAAIISSFPKLKMAFLNGENFSSSGKQRSTGFIFESA